MEFWLLAALVLFAATVTGVLIAGVSGCAAATGSPRAPRDEEAGSG
jgi:hypothetical protein